MKCLVLLTVISINVIGIYSAEKAALKATTILEAPYVKLKDEKITNSTKLEDYEGYIPDFLHKISEKLGRKFTIHIVEDKKYGAKIDGAWNGMIGEVQSGKADIAAAPITTSDDRKTVVDFTEPFMTFDSLVIMKKGTPHSEVRSAADLHKISEVKVGVVRDGFTENFFKNTPQTVYRQMYERMEKTAFPLTSAEGVTKVRDGNGKYAFVIEGSTADYWINRKPCDLVAFRLGSALPYHDYSFAIKKNSEFKNELNTAINELKSNGEHDMLRAKWWPTECSGAVSYGPTALSSLLAVLTAAVGAIRFKLL